MKLKYVLPLTLFFALSASAEWVGNNNGNNNNNNNNGNGNNQSTSSKKASFCVQHLQEFQQAKTAQPGTPQLKSHTECHALQIAAKANKGTLEDEKDQKVSRDGRIRCVLKAGYTMDYDSCKTGVNAYHWILDLEQALHLVQKVRFDEKQKSLANDVARAQAKGEGQEAAFDAAAATSEFNNQMNQEQAVAYAGAVTTLSGVLLAWTTEKSAPKKCKNYAPEASVLKPLDCTQAVQMAVKISPREVIANEDAKAALTSAVFEFTAKGVKAGIAAAMFKKMKRDIDASKPQFSDEEMIKLEQCAYTPMHPACIGKGGRTSESSVVAGDFQAGNGQGNAFDNNGSGDQAFGEEGAPTDVAGAESVASVSNPFSDQAKEASGILNPAAAATLTPGGGAGGGGGGGAGGGGGGGSATLGDDLSGADGQDNKEKDIKAKSVKGSYAANGGGGFQGVKEGKEEGNPFSSLFDGQEGAGGGIEEDRSIASGDIDGQDSGLFQKISKRYGQVQADKRLEANNLE